MKEERKQRERKRNVGNQVDIQPNNNENGSLPKTKGKVKNLIMNFEKKRLDEERNGYQEKNGKERGVKKIGRKKTVSSTSSPAIKKV